MNLPPLPLIDGCLFLDNSALELLQTCPRAFQHNRLDSRIITGERHALNFGTAMHKALEWRYKNCKNTPPTDQDTNSMVSIMETMFAEHPMPDEDDHRNLNFGIELLQKYNTKYHQEPFNILVDKDDKPMVELAFALPLFVHKCPKDEGIFHVQPNGFSIQNEIPIYFTGRIDLPISYDGQLMIMDHKTDSMFFGPTTFLNEQKASNQYRGYCWAFERLTGKTIDGYVVNGIRTKSPPKTKPRNMSIDQWWDESFVRDITHLALYPGWQDKWRNDAITLIEQMFWLYSRGELNMLGKFTRACSRYGGCQYRDVCLAPTEEKGSEILHSSIYKLNEWTPLEKTTKTKEQ